MAYALVTPSSRGIGFALTRHLLKTTSPSVPIIATARTDLPSIRDRILDSLPPESKASERLDLQTLDFNSESTIQDLAAYCKDRYGSRTDGHLRQAFCIPGRLTPERSPAAVEYDSALETLKLNLLTPMLLAKHLVPLLPTRRSPSDLPQVSGLNSDHAIFSFMSARVGSISDNAKGGWYSYRASKAGVNQLVKSLDIFLKGKSGGRSMCVGLHPGTVKTDLSREFWGSVADEKLFEPEFAAERLCEVVGGLDGEAGGRCWDWKGEQIMP